MVKGRRRKENGVRSGRKNEVSKKGRGGRKDSREKRTENYVENRKRKKRDIEIGRNV